MLSIKNATKMYDNKKVLDTISLHIPKGSIALLLGQSGVGKSTLLRVLCGLEELDTGVIELDGKKLTAHDIIKNHQTGMVFQHFNLFDHLTVEQNITLPLEKVLGKTQDQAQKIAHDLLVHYGLAEKKDARIRQLSGGQKQRLALARATALKPAIICLDEPTSALDPLLTSHVARTIQELAASGYIVVIATHDTALIERLNCMIYLMKNGKIIQSADAQEFRNHPDDFKMINTFVTGTIEK